MRPLNKFRYVMIGGALNGRSYELPRDIGPEFRLPPSDKAMQAWTEARRKYDASSTGGWASPAHAPKPPADIVYHALTIQMDTLHGIEENEPDEVTTTRFCVPDEWGTDPEQVAKQLIRFMVRMNNATHAAVTQAGYVTPEIMRLGKFVGIFHR